MFITCVRGDELPTLITMTKAGFTNLIVALTGTVNYNQVTNARTVGDIDFPYINFHGSTVLFDDGQPANTIYFLNLKYAKLIVHQDRDMSIRDFIAPSNQDLLVGRMFWAGNLVFSNLARQGRMGGTIDA